MSLAKRRVLTAYDDRLAGYLPAGAVTVSSRFFTSFIVTGSSSSST